MARPVEGLQTQTEPAIALPQFRVIANRETNAIRPIPVDLILDVGNSRTCGILIEDHGQSGSGLMHNYVLKLRDLSAPEHVYTEPFESRVEFSQAFFGKDHCSVRLPVANHRPHRRRGRTAGRPPPGQRRLHRPFQPQALFMG